MDVGLGYVSPFMIADPSQGRNNELKFDIRLITTKVMNMFTFSLIFYDSI